jgi:hypothetical protein
VAAGTQTLSVTFTPTDTTDYTTATATATLTVNVPPSFTVSSTAVAVSPGATTGNISTITLTPSGGFTGSVALTASVTSSPNGAQDLPTLSFGSTSPVSITGAAAVTATLNISTTAATVGALRIPERQGDRWFSAGGAALACLLVFGVPTRRRSLWTMLGLLVFLGILSGGFVGCGGNGQSTGNPGTTAGNYTVTVTATSGSTSAVSTVTVTVQ